MGYNIVFQIKLKKLEQTKYGYVIGIKFAFFNFFCFFLRIKLNEDNVCIVTNYYPSRNGY